MTEDRGRNGLGGALALALAAAALSVVHPVLLMFVPVSLLLLALPPRRASFVVTGAILLAVALAGPRGGLVWYAERGWALILGAWFVAAVVLLPAAGFFARALSAVGATVASVLLLFLGDRAGWQRLDGSVTARLREATSQMAALWSDGGQMSGSFAQAIERTAELQAEFYPALLALASLAALGVAWWAYRRVAARHARPLRPLREFRFNDDLVWLLIAGVLLLVLPLGAAGRWAGSNVVVFMLGLYALRGVGVLLALTGAQGAIGVVVGGLALLFLYPLVMAASLVLGLTDTWLDLRARRRAAAGPGS